MRPREDVDAVDLMQVEPLDRAAEMRGGGQFRTFHAETLRGERDAPRERQADPFHRHQLCRAAISAGGSQPNTLRPP